MSSPSSRWFHQGKDLARSSPSINLSLRSGKSSRSSMSVTSRLVKKCVIAIATTLMLRLNTSAAIQRSPPGKSSCEFIFVPFKNTEIQDPKTRSRQTATYTPSELTAYQEFTQKDFSNVPKLLGYKVSTQDKSGLVPGLRLGDKLGNDPYWTLSAVEREHVRMAFMKALPQALEKGYGPYTPSLSKLVWHSQTGTLYFIGYIYGINNEPKDRSNIKIGPEALARYGLAKPSSNEWRNKNWNGDTTGWKM